MVEVLTKEQMKQLEDLGIDTSDASLHYYKWTDDYGETGGDYCADPYGSNIEYHAYTLNDILKKLPKVIKRADDITEEYIWKLEHDSISYYNDITFNHIKVCRGDLLINIAYELLIWVINEKYLIIEK